MQLACSGDRQAVGDFFRVFLETPLFAPRRRQNFPLTDSPVYPAEIFDFMGIRASQAVYLPVFTRAPYIKDWSGVDFIYRTTSGKHLINVLPEQWRIVLNPGQEFEKEFSEWEVEQLRSGVEAITEIVDEMFSVEDSGDGLDVLPVDREEYVELIRVLCELGKTSEEICEIFLHLESCDEQQKLVVGVVVKNGVAENVLKQQLTGRIAPHLIGDRPFIVLTVRQPTKKDQLMFGRATVGTKVYPANPG